jgi:signal transduction histidine kinase
MRSSNTRLLLIYGTSAVLMVIIFLLFAGFFTRSGDIDVVPLGLTLWIVAALAAAAVDYFVVRPAKRDVAAALHRSQAELELRVAERTEALRRNAERLAILHEIDQSLLAARRPEIIALAAIGRIRRLVPCQYALVIALEPDGQLRVLASQSAANLPDTGKNRHSRPDLYGDLVSEPILNRGQIMGAQDLETLAGRSRLQQALYDMGARGYVVVPLMTQDELVGTLNLESGAARSFTTNHVTIAREVATSLAVAIRQARLYAQVQQELEERMQAEASLQRRTEDLEERNAELDAFAHTVAHDLKNPLAALLGSTELLTLRRGQLSKERQRDYLQIITRSGNKISTIVDELLLLSSVRAREDIELEPLDMGRIVSEVQIRLQDLADELGGKIQIPEEWPISLGYAPWVEEVWVNYISNALKYGGQPPRVELGFSLPNGQAQTRDLAIRYWVRDDGPGLTPEQQAMLFTPFERLHQGRAEGHGLGLSIVQRIVQKLGGRVGVESAGQPGEGSTFFFTLPPAFNGDK